jgi:hypothetical protein
VRLKGKGKRNYEKSVHIMSRNHLNRIKWNENFMLMCDVGRFFHNAVPGVGVKTKTKAIKMSKKGQRATSVRLVANKQIRSSFEEVDDERKLIRKKGDLKRKSDGKFYKRSSFSGDEAKKKRKTGLERE